MRKEDRSNAAERLLDDGQEQRLCWGGGGVADADAFKDRAGGEEAGYRGGEGLEGVLGLWLGGLDESVGNWCWTNVDLVSGAELAWC